MVTARDVLEQLGEPPEQPARAAVRPQDILQRLQDEPKPERRRVTPQDILQRLEVEPAPEPEPEQKRVTPQDLLRRLEESAGEPSFDAPAQAGQVTAANVLQRAETMAQEDDGSAFERILGAIVQGAQRPFEDQDLGLGEETKNRLRDVGLLNRPGEASPLKTFNDMVLVGGAAGADLLLRTGEAAIQGAISGIGQTAREFGASSGEARRLERDLNQIVLSVAAVSGQAPASVTRGRRRPGGARERPRADAPLEEGPEPTRIVQQVERRVDQLEMPSPDARAQLKTRAAEAATDALDRASLEQMRSKIGQPTLGETTRAARFSFGDKVLTETLDQLRPIKSLATKEAKRRGIPPDLSPYNEMRLLAGVRGSLDTLFNKNTFFWNERGELVRRGAGLKDVFAPVADDLDNAMLFFTARRARELQQRGIKTPFSQREIDAALRLGERNPAIVQTFDEFQQFNRRVLDFAEQSGLLDAETKRRFLEAGQNYVPFYRLVTDDLGEVRRTTKGGLFRRLKGGEAPLRDVLDNITRNAAMWTELGIRNKAKADVYSMIERFGLDDIAERVRTKPEMATVADRQAREALEQMGFAKPGKGVAVFTAGRKPLGENIDVVFRNGQREFWRIKDPEFLKAMNAANPKSFGLGLRVLGGFSNVLRRGVTLAPDFLLRNLVRDAQAGFIQSQANFVPVIDSVRGLGARIVKNDDYWDLILNGGGFATTYAGETGAGRNLRRFYGRHGFSYDRVLDTPRKIADAAEELSSAFEMSTRLAEFQKMRARGATLREAALGAREVSTDFGLRGASPLIQGLAVSVPFLNARAQGLSKLVRSARGNPGRVALKGLTAFTLPGLALYALNRDNPDYQALPDWIRDQHWVIFPAGSGEPFLIPKGFEFGSIFGTVPERMFEAIEEQHGKRFSDAMLRMVLDTLSFNPIPQAAKPLLEGGDPFSGFTGFNRKFTGAPVVPADLEDVRRSEQFRPWTSETMVELARILREDTGVEMSPLQAENLVKGYFGTLGMYALSAADMMVRGAQDTDAPQRRLDETPVLRSFFREQPFRGTQFETDFYDLLGSAREASATFAKMVREARLPDLDERERRLNAIRPAMDKVAGQSAEINRQMRLVQLNQAMSAEEKRTRLDQLQKQRNEMFVQFMRALPAEIRREEALTPAPEPTP